MIDPSQLSEWSVIGVLALILREFRGLRMEIVALVRNEIARRPKE